MSSAPATDGRGELAAPAPRRPSALLAFAELRLRLLWRRLGARGGIPELVARVALFAIVVPAGLAFAALSAVGAWKAVRAGTGIVAELPVTALLFGVWQTWTAVSLSISERDAVDLRRFLVYPLPPSRVFGYGLVASVVADPFAVFWSLMLGGAFVGAAVARPGVWLVLLAAAYVLFVAATTALVTLLQELLARVLRGRRVRELAIAAVYVGTGFVLVFVTSGPRSATHALRVLKHVRWLAFPPALGERAISALYAGRHGAALGWLALLVPAAVAAAWAAYRLALSAALSGGDAPPRAPASGSRGWRLPGRLGPLLEKEGKYVLRHPIASLLVMLIPAFAAFVAWKLTPRIPADAGEVVRVLPLLAFALYAHVATQTFWLNAFGWERGGGRVWFLAPVRAEDVLLAKNAAVYALSLALFVASTGAAVAAGGAPPAWALAGALALHAGIAPFFLGAGNLVSILNPRSAPYTIQRGAHLAPASALAGMAIVSAGSALFAAPVLLAIHLEEPWLLAGGWAALGALGLVLYRLALGRAARLLGTRREALLEAVCGDDL